MSAARDRLLSHFWGRQLSHTKVRVAASLKSNEGGLVIGAGVALIPSLTGQINSKKLARVLQRSRKWRESLREIDLNPRSRGKIRISLQF